LRLVEGIGDFAGNLHRLIERQPPGLEARGQRLPVEMGHDQIVGAIDTADVVDAADVGMLERRDRLGLAFETGAPLRIAGDLGRQHLDRDRPIEARVAGPIDLPHTAGADRGGHFIRAEPRARG
jgi:hypothetical protein